jgi:hypothetical protein
MLRCKDAVHHGYVLQRRVCSCKQAQYARLRFVAAVGSETLKQTVGVTQGTREAGC